MSLKSSFEAADSAASLASALNVPSGMIRSVEVRTQIGDAEVVDKDLQEGPFTSVVTQVEGREVSLVLKLSDEGERLAVRTPVRVLGWGAIVTANAKRTKAGIDVRTFLIREGRPVRAGWLLERPLAALAYRTAAGHAQAALAKAQKVLA